MRIVIDPVPLVLGIYAFVGETLSQAVTKIEGEGADALGRRMSRERTENADRDVQRMVRALHGDVKVADKLLKKTGDVWKISQETDLVEIVIGPRGKEGGPRAYVLLKPKEIKALLQAIRSAAAGAGEDQETLGALDRSVRSLEEKSNDYLSFGFDEWAGR